MLSTLAARLFGTPLMIHRPKLEVILAVLGPRMGLTECAALPRGDIATEAARTAPAQIAVLPIVGTLVRRTSGMEAQSGLVSYTSIARQLDAAVANPSVAGILLDIDSPGGESAGVFDLADRIKAANTQKPVFAVTEGQAFSAAYALASGASRLFVSRTGGVGSIGVLAMHVDQSAKDAQEGMHYTTVFAGQRKNDLNPHEALSDDALAVLRTEIDRVYGLFIATVARHRALSLEAIRATEAGLFFSEHAVTAGLADAVGTFDDALQALAQTVASRAIPVITAHAHTAPGKKAIAKHASPLAPTHRASSKETPMSDDPTPELLPSAVEEVKAPPPIDVPPVSLTAAATPLSLAQAQAIAELCLLAGIPERTAELLATGSSEAHIRRWLLESRAAQRDISSRITQDAGTQSAPATSPLIAAVEKLIA